MPLSTRASKTATPIVHPCSFQQPLCLWDIDQAPASVWGQSHGEVLEWLRTAFSVYNCCRVIAYNGNSSIMNANGTSAPLPGSQVRLREQLTEVSCASAAHFKDQIWNIMDCTCVDEWKMLMGRSGVF